MPKIRTIRFDRVQLRKAMRSHRFTPTELAARAGVSSSTVGRLARGEPVGELVAQSFARALRTNLKVLVLTEPNEEANRGGRPNGNPDRGNER